MRFGFLQALAVLVAGAFALPSHADPAGSAFTYQGMLKSAGSPYTGTADLKFRLYDRDPNGTQIGVQLEAHEVHVDAGLVTVELDFGASAFNGDARWLEVEVCTPSGGPCEVLLPRQRLNAGPYAIRSLTALGTVPVGGMILIETAAPTPGYTSMGLTIETKSFWTRLADAPTARTCAAATVGSEIHVLGSSFTLHEVYTPATDTWSTAAPFIPGSNVTGYALAGESSGLYLVGGSINGSTPTNTFYRWTAATDSWTQRANMNFARGGCAAVMHNGLVYALSGVSTNGQMTSTMESYDPATDTWTLQASLPVGWAGGQAVVSNGMIYFMGGSASTVSNNVYRYDTVANTWSTLLPMPQARTSHGIALLGGTIYVFGGGIGGGVMTDTTDAYDIAAGSWRRVGATINGARASLGSAVVNGKAYAIGGLTSTPFQLFNTTEVLTPPTELFVHRKD